MSTTAEKIRDRLIAVIEALTPTSLSRDKFRAYRNEGDADFQSWAAQFPASGFRRFQIRDTGEDEHPEVSNEDCEERKVTFSITVAYPQTSRTGKGAALDRDDVIQQDRRSIDRAIGMIGRANLSAPYPDACWLKDGSSAPTRIEGDGVDFLEFRYQYLFQQSNFPENFGALAVTLGALSCSAAATSPHDLIVIMGDSNCVGLGLPSTLDTAATYAAVYPSVQLNSRLSFNPGNPFTDFATDDLQPFNGGAGDRMGMELTFGRELYENGGIAPTLGKIGQYGTTVADWNTTLASELTDYIDARVAETSKTLGAVVISLGTNDAADAGIAGAYQANLTTLAAAIRAEYGSYVKIALVETQSTVPNPHVATVRAAALAYVASDPNSTLIKAEGVPTTDLYHYSADGYATIGQRAAYAVVDLIGLGRYSTGSIPQYLGHGPGVLGAGTLTPESWGGGADGDLEFLVVETTTASAAITLSDAQGFTAVAGGEQSSAWLGAFYANTKVWSRPVVQATLDANLGAMPRPTVADSNASNAAKIYTVRGPSGLPTIHQVGGGVNDGNGTTLNLATFTTTDPNCLVLHFIGGFSNTAANAATLTNAALAGIVNHPASMLAVIEKNFLALSTGTKAAAGIVGTSAVVMDNAATMGGVTIAVAP
jgi:lysophospholipase L1-like esterase